MPTKAEVAEALIHAFFARVRGRTGWTVEMSHLNAKPAVVVSARGKMFKLVFDDTGTVNVHQGNRDANLRPVKALENKGGRIVGPSGEDGLDVIDAEISRHLSVRAPTHR